MRSFEDSRLNPGNWPFPVIVLVVGVLFGLFAMVVHHAIERYLDAPTVYVSWTTRECVRVDDPAAKAQRRKPYTCDNLPETFEAVWVR